MRLPDTDARGRGMMVERNRAAMTICDASEHGGHHLADLHVVRSHLLRAAQTMARLRAFNTSVITGTKTIVARLTKRLTFVSS